MNYPYTPPYRTLTDDQRNTLWELRNEGMRRCEGCGSWVEDDWNVVCEDCGHINDPHPTNPKERP